MDKMAWCKAKCPKWPVAKKCCFCVPIRKGVTIFGYVNLVSIFTCRRMPVDGGGFVYFCRLLYNIRS